MVLIFVSIVFVGLYAFNHAGISQGARESLNFILFILIASALALCLLSVLAPGGPNLLKLLQ